MICINFCVKKNYKVLLSIQIETWVHFFQAIIAVNSFFPAERLENAYYIVNPFLAALMWRRNRLW